MKTKFVITLLICFIFSCKNEVNTEIKKTPMITNNFKAEKTKETHLAKTQFYRWYQLYEREMNPQRIANQMDILSNDIIIKTAAGEMKGKSNYPLRLDAYKGWQNAHHVQNIEVIKTGDKTFSLKADINYQNIKPTGEETSYHINYNTVLEKTNTLLPRFKKLEITPTRETKDDFEDAYINNRANSLLYYWLANMEQLDGNIEPFKEILSENFQLNFSTSNQINSLDGFEKWLQGTPMTLSQSNHHPKNLKVSKTNANEYKLNVDFDWYGISKEGKKITAKTRHEWIVVDNLNERFSRIKQVDVTQIEPFKVLE